jgi:hypothetical protein
MLDILEKSRDPELQAYITASRVRSAITVFKVATGLACVTWIIFFATFFTASTCLFRFFGIFTLWLRPVFGFEKTC